MKSDRGKQSHVFVWLGVKAVRSARDLRLVLLFVLMTTVCLSVTGQVGPDAPKTRPIKRPSMKASKKPPPVRAPSRDLDAKGEVLETLRNSFIRMPAGEFIMGSENGYRNEKPVHRVRISQGFEMGKYEVTQAQWQAVMGSNPSNFKGANLPVETVLWDDVHQFVQKLNARNDGYVYRLPTEAEWEYACRAGTPTAFAFGDGLSSEQANFDGSRPYGNAPKGKDLKRTVVVGSYPPNAWGLYDMHGNVWEWCQDWYNETYYTQGSSVDPRGPAAGQSRAYRGGGWSSPADYLRSAFRGMWLVKRGESSSESSVVGFRLVRTRN